MSLNNIQLNSAQLAQLYRTSLVEQTASEQRKTLVEKTTSQGIDEALDQVTVSLKNEWKFLGENKKNVLLVVRYPDATYLPDNQLNFLVSILGACKLSLADIAILNLANSPIDTYNGVFDHFKSRVTVLFGITAEQFGMPVSFPEFQVQAFNNCTFLHGPTLEMLESDKVLKSKLWVCLRRMFGV